MPVNTMLQKPFDFKFDTNKLMDELKHELIRICPVPKAASKLQTPREQQMQSNLGHSLQIAL